MTTQVYGSTGGQQIQRNRKYSADGTITDSYRMQSSDAAAFIASYTIGTSTIGSLVLAEIEEATVKGGSRVTLKYTTPAKYNMSYGGTTADIRGADTSAQDLPIRTHPACNDPNPKLDVWSINGVLKPEVDVFAAPVSTYEYSTVENTFTWSEANVLSGVGKRSSPTGMTGVTDNKWLKTSRRISQEGEKFRVTQVWQAAPVNETWDTDIYEAE